MREGWRFITFFCMVLVIGVMVFIPLIHRERMIDTCFWFGVEYCSHGGNLVDL